MKTVKNITTAQLAQILSEVKGTTYASVLYFVDESKSRQVKGTKLVRKLTFASVTLGSDYAKKVNRIQTNKQGVEDANFEAQKMSGRTVIHPCIVQSDKTGILGMYGIIENHNLKHVRRKMFFDGKLWDTKELENAHFADIAKGGKGMFAPAYFNEVVTMGRGSVDKDNNFGIVTPFLTNIRKIKLNKQVYKVVE